MGLSLGLLTTKSEGEEVKNLILTIKDELAFNKLEVVRERNGISGKAGTLNKDYLAAVKAVADQQEVWESTTDPDDKALAKEELTVREYEVVRLLRRLRQKGPVAVIGLDLESDQFDKRIEYLDSSLVAVNARIADLPD